MTWAELVRKIKACGFREHRTGKGSHRQFAHPVTGDLITIAMHTKKEVGTGLAQRIIRDAEAAAARAEAVERQAEDPEE